MKQIEINPSNEYHILRHFESVPDSYKSSLLNKEYYYHNIPKDKFEKGIISGEDIAVALETKGSKFFRGIPGIATPTDMLRIAQAEFERIPYPKQNWKGNSCIYLINFSKNY